jgi:hypothetical protein
MRINQSNTNGFDDLLKSGLRNHAVHVPSGFSHKLLTRIQRQEYAAALTAIKMKERLLLAVMILLPIAAAAVMLLLPHQIIMQCNALIADVRQIFLFYAAKIDLVLRHWIEIAVIVAILVYVFLDFALTEE